MLSTQERNQIKVTNFICECNFDYCRDFNCTLRQRSRNLSKITFSFDVKKELKNVDVSKLNFVSGVKYNETSVHSYYIVLFNNKS